MRRLNCSSSAAICLRSLSNTEQLTLFLQVPGEGDILIEIDEVQGSVQEVGSFAHGPEEHGWRQA